MKTLICDIDGTLADCRHRLHHVLPGGRRDWDAFFATMDQDTLIEPVARVVWGVAQLYPVVMCSGRPEKYRVPTERWLDRHSIPFHALYMRPDNDTRADHVVKMELLAAMRADGYEPFLVVDDRASVVQAWRDAGLVCLQAAPSEPPAPSTALLTIMVGPSGGGKSTYCRHMAGVISSDQIRQELCGDFRCQDRNVEVFAALHALAACRLKHSLPTVIDATNLRRKDRMTCAALANSGPVEYVVVDRPLQEKRRDGGWRLSVEKNGEPFDLIGAHAQTFGSQLRDILAGDGLDNVVVRDLRILEHVRRAA